MAIISFAQTVGAMRDDLRVEFREHLPFAAVVALTRTALIARDRMKQHIREAFDKPTPYAVNAPRAMPATKASMASAVYLRDFGGTPAADYLGPEINGGGRKQKRFERALSFIGALPSGGYAVPGAGAKIDQYGNQSRGQIVQILSALNAFGEQGYRANKKTSPKGQSRIGQIFVVRYGDNHPGLKPGVYQRTATGVKPLIAFLKSKPTYRVRLPFNALVEADAAKIFPAQLSKALAEFGKN
jgi:hypothetical protein